MKIIIIGAGKIGSTIVKHVCNEAHEVIVIDNEKTVIESIINKYDVMGICGNGVSYDIQKSAGVSNADLLIAVTALDESNMLACLIAKKLGVKSTIARVRDPEYTEQVKMMSEALGITMTINPEKLAASEIMRILNFPDAIKVDNFAHGNVELVELTIPEKSSLVGMPLSQVNSKYMVNLLVGAVSRGEDVFIPMGSFKFEAMDKIYIISDRYNSRVFMNKIGYDNQKLKEILIIGGGKIALYLGEELIKNRFRVKIIERDLERCKELSEALPSANIIHGDGSDQILLSEEGINQSDAVICLTGIDEENIIISLYANKQNVKKVITKINKSSFAGLLESVKLSSVISPQDIVASQIVSYIRATSNATGNNVKTLYKLVGDEVEALEFEAKSSSKLLNVELKNLKIKNDNLIGAIIRDGHVIIPKGDSIIIDGDSVIVVTKDSMLTDLDDILE